MPAEHGTCHPALALGFLVAILLVAAVSIAGYRRRQGASSNASGALLGGTLRGWYREAMGPMEAMLVGAGINASTLTVTQLVLSAAAGVCFALGALFLGGVLVLGCGTLDVLDGGVARRAGRAGREGAFVDSVVDRYAEAATFLGLAFFFRASVMLWVVIVGLVGSFMVSYARARAEGLGAECSRGWLQRPERYVLLGMGSLFSVIGAHLACSADFARGHYLLGAVVVILALLAHLSAMQRIVATRRALRGEGAGGRTSGVSEAQLGASAEGGACVAETDRRQYTRVVDPSAGKVARIAGFSILLLGGGVVLDLDARAAGAAVTAVGVTVFAAGLIRGWRAARLNAASGEVR